MHYDIHIRSYMILGPSNPIFETVFTFELLKPLIFLAYIMLKICEEGFRKVCVCARVLASRVSCVLKGCGCCWLFGVGVGVGVGDGDGVGVVVVVVVAVAVAVAVVVVAVAVAVCVCVAGAS